jgi:hypothetical protein
MFIIAFDEIGLSVPAVIWALDDLTRRRPTRTADIVGMSILYLRLAGWWAASVLFLLLSHARSTCRSESIAHRLEMI